MSCQILVPEPFDDDAAPSAEVDPVFADYARREAELDFDSQLQPVRGLRPR